MCVDFRPPLAGPFFVRVSVPGTRVVSSARVLQGVFLSGSAANRVVQKMDDVRTGVVRDVSGSFAANQAGSDLHRLYREARKAGMGFALVKLEVQTDA